MNANQYSLMLATWPASACPRQVMFFLLTDIQLQQLYSVLQNEAKRMLVLLFVRSCIFPWVSL